MKLHRRTRALLIVVAVALALTLAGCGGRQRPEPIIVPQKVFVPQAVSCVPVDTPAAPTVYPDSDDALRAATDPAERYRLLTLGRADRIARLNILEPVVEGCRK